MLVLALLLTGCGGGISNPACPPLVAYSPEEQARAADSLEALPPGAALRKMIDDYGTLRAMIRACIGANLNGQRVYKVVYLAHSMPP